MKLDPYAALAACQKWAEVLDAIDEQHPGVIQLLQEAAGDVADHAGLKAPMRILLGQTPETAVHRMFKHPSVYGNRNGTEG